MLYTIQLKPEPRPNVMAETLGSIKLDLVTEYENTGHLDIGDWVARYPEHREELLEFWLWLRGTRDLAKEDLELSVPLSLSEMQVYEEAIRNASMAVTLGPAIIKPSVDPEKQDEASAEQDAFADQLVSFRRKPRQYRDSHGSFRKAVVCTWVVSRMQGTRPQVSRLAAQKATYLLEHAMALGVFTEHERKPFGPYDRKARYLDAEPIAKRKGWLRVSGSTLRAADDVSAVEGYAKKYLRSEEAASWFVQSINKLSDNELEVLATVHWTARDLRVANEPINAASVATALSKSGDWSSKLERRYFTAARIDDAINFLQSVRLL